ncbi:hypothetical protein DOTSEDRAFT_38805 [Dothistroma septosporum NZE10]|uniref:Uncharacterized protein n=1 Tax=Dothistroma septosporum (strain NZE10 / CBS 128990) TaxID=675120 RepID=M2XJM1_DOTSN|nr:hypothetical protein DOTSEDRAFT_38805 [Dothistroma septosporum NZE10]
MLEIRHAPESVILDFDGKTPLLALFIGNMRFGHDHQESNIAGISHQVKKRIAAYSNENQQPPLTPSQRSQDPLLPPLVLCGRYADNNIYLFLPGVHGGLEDSLKELFRVRSSTEDMAKRCEAYLEILAGWNSEAFPQLKKRRRTLRDSGTGILAEGQEDLSREAELWSAGGGEIQTSMGDGTRNWVGTSL